MESAADEAHHNVRAVFVGDLVSFYTELVRIGRTSITVKVTVEEEYIVLQM